MWQVKHLKGLTLVSEGGMSAQHIDRVVLLSEVRPPTRQDMPLEVLIAGEGLPAVRAKHHLDDDQSGRGCFGDGRKRASRKNGSINGLMTQRRQVHSNQLSATPGVSRRSNKKLCMAPDGTLGGGGTSRLAAGRALDWQQLQILPYLPHNHDLYTPVWITNARLGL